MKRKILIMGLRGAGKTTLARVLAPMLNATLFNADDVRENINKDPNSAAAQPVSGEARWDQRQS